MYFISSLKIENREDEATPNKRANSEKYMFLFRVETSRYITQTCCLLIILTKSKHVTNVNEDTIKMQRLEIICEDRQLVFPIWMVLH